MKQNIYRRILAYVMIISILLPIATEFVKIPAVATESASTQTTETVSVEELTRGTQILRHIDEKVLSANQHVLRLPAEEALSSYAFLNRDGSMTVYYLDKAVKFRDQSGEIVEKDIRLTKTLSGFKTITNDVGLLLPDDPAKGISLSYGGYEITLVPEGGALRKTAQMDEEFVTYPNYFGSGASLKYTPALDGLKEDIVLSHYSGINSFAFRLYTDGLRMYQKNGRYYLAEAADAKVRISLGDVVAFDARGRFSVGKMAVQTVTLGQEYVLTLSVDESFLTADSTTYPVSIDPTLTISDTTHGAGAIEDITLYSGAKNANCDWQYLHCGYYDSTYKVARTMFRLTGLLNDATYQNTPAEDITSVKFYIKEATGTAALPVYLYANTGSAAWTETGATWNNAGYVLGTLYGTASPGVNQLVNYDITALVQAWKNGTEDGQKGFVMVSSNETTKDKAFYGSESTNTSYRPYVAVSYDAGTSFDNAIRITTRQNVPVSITADGEPRYFRVSPTFTGFYTIYSSNNSADPQMWLYNSNKPVEQEIASNDNREPGEFNFGLTYHLIQNVTYYIKVGEYEGLACTFNFTVSSTPNSDYLSTDPLSIGQGQTVSISKDYKVQCYTFVAPQDGYYVFQSGLTTGNAMIWIYNSSLQLFDYDESGDNMFRANTYLASDVTYYIVVGYNGSATGAIYFVPLMPITIPEGTDYFHLQVADSELYMDICETAEQDHAGLQQLGQSSQARWDIETQSGGYYTIKTQDGTNRYLGISSTNIGEDNIVMLSAADTDNALWNIYGTVNGELMIEPKLAPGKVIVPSSCLQGSKLRLAWAATPFGNLNKWKIGVQLDVTLEAQQGPDWCWAAAARMLVSNYQPVSNDYTQEIAVNSYAALDEGGTIEYAAMAARYYMSGSSANYRTYFRYSDTDILTEEGLRKVLDHGDAVYVAITHYYPSYEGNKGHALVIVGYTTQIVDKELKYQFIIFDPWPENLPADAWPENNVPTTGQVRIESYDQLYYQEKISTNNEEYIAAWGGYMMRYVEYLEDCDETIGAIDAMRG